MESLQNEVATHFGATPLCSIRGMLLASSQRSRCIDVDAQCKRSLKVQGSLFSISVFCRGRRSGVYPHPLHCWQYVTCGAPYGGDKELTCYSGRRFVPLTFECLPDKTCIYGTFMWSVILFIIACLLSTLDPAYKDFGYYEHPAN